MESSTITALRIIELISDELNLKPGYPELSADFEQKLVAIIEKSKGE